MKKIMIAVAIVCAAAFAHAANVNWTMMSYDNVMNPDGQAEYSGLVTVACAELGWSQDINVSGGFFYEGPFVIDSELDHYYDFTITAAYTDGDGVAWTYAGTGFGSTDTFGGDTMAGFSAGTWTAAPVPEPTSGLLLLLGVAGLALKRKRA